MSFKPKRNQQNEGSSDRVYPAPASNGTQPARVSLIVDLGTQQYDDAEVLFNPEDAKHKEREAAGAEFVVPAYGENKGKRCILMPRKPCQGLAIFVDLVDEKVNYGEALGDQYYRYMLNHNYKGDIIPIAFKAAPPKGESKLWTFDPKSILSKLAHATGKLEVVSEGDANMDISLLLDQPFLIDIDVKQTVKGDKTYTNVKHNSVAKLMKGMVVNELATPARLVTFDNATAEDVKFIRKDVRAKIMASSDFAGSQMQKAFKEAGFGGGEAASNSNNAPAQQAPQRPVVDAPNHGSFDEDIPFSYLNSTFAI